MKIRETVEDQARHFVPVTLRDTPYKIEKAIQDSLKGVVSAKMLRRMKSESISCPVMLKELPFLECFVCSNFLRRVRGEVHCAGHSNPTRNL